MSSGKSGFTPIVWEDVIIAMNGLTMKIKTKIAQAFVSYALMITTPRIVTIMKTEIKLEGIFFKEYRVYKNGILKATYTKKDNVIFVRFK